MTISGDYPHPVQVNGFSCHNCAEVDLAKRFIDPAHPKDGPFGVNATHSPTHGPAVRLDGALAGLATTSTTAAAPTIQGAAGSVLDVKA